MSDKELHDWINKNGLDQGPTASKHVRSDAIWLAENWPRLHGRVTQSHPTHIRIECRHRARRGEAEFQWALPRERPQKNTGDKKQKSKPTDPFEQAVEQLKDQVLPCVAKAKRGTVEKAFDEFLHKWAAATRTLAEANLPKHIPVERERLRQRDEELDRVAE